jgi:hypothetical protein
VLSVAVPWTASAIQLLTLDGFPRGRSGTILVENTGWVGDGDIVLALRTPLDPPILTAIPTLFIRHLQPARLRSAADLTATPHSAMTAMQAIGGGSRLN